MLQEAEALLRGLSLRACSAEGTTCRTRNDTKETDATWVALKLDAAALLTPLAPVLAGT